MAGWLTGDHADRARYLDMQTRFRAPYLFGIAIGGTSLIAAGWYGWRLVALVVLASLVMVAGVALGHRSARPEVSSAAAFVLLEVDLAVSVGVSGGARSPLLALMAVPVFTQAVCFRPVVTRSGVVLSALLAVLAVLGARELSAVAAVPAFLYLVSYLALLACLSLAAYYLAAADLASRGAAAVDPLTGLFNRAALEARFAEVRAQAIALDLPVAVVMCDLDEFKGVNDTHGHDRGDRVLLEFSVRLRSALRTPDLIYRLGGDEFLVLLPDHDLDAAEGMAERVRQQVATTPVAGLPVTMSAGVSSARGAAIDLAALMKGADVALYRAKTSGRDRVHATTPA